MKRKDERKSDKMEKKCNKREQHKKEKLVRGMSKREEGGKEGREEMTKMMAWQREEMMSDED